jgi:hypothetical protein
MVASLLVHKKMSSFAGYGYFPFLATKKLKDLTKVGDVGFWK